ncbi:hypothetical protein SHKM778_51710 [Streptomyces sp. KM77-8]|uniref:AB hydrolase-1 domain-containing protein n=1 Tax=Streptomyces haneummycinicus TaxID=3074435 RepID=A0AAT9HNH0_9ACTN
MTVAGAVIAALWRGRRRSWQGRLVPFMPVLVAAALTLSVCVPTVPTTRRYPSALTFVTTEHWRLSTGSRVAVYHYPPTGNSPRHRVPLVYLHGGPVRGISVLDHHFLRRLAGQGYDVYAYEQAGGGRSDLLPMDQYSITRSVHDLGAFVGKLGKGRVDVLGFSSGAAVLTRALADRTTAAHLRRAVIAEPGPMDGPTARMTGRKGRPSARGIAPAMAGPRSTRPSVRGRFRPHAARTAQSGHRAGRIGGGRQRVHRRRSRQRHRVRLLRAGRAPHPGRGHGAELLLQRRRQPPHPANDQRLPSIAPRLRRSRTPAMLMIAECSSQVRQWGTTILANNPAVQRTQFMPGVGHHMWNGLGDNDQRAAAVITAFLQDKPAPLPDYPTRAGIPAFLRD